jgi:phosphoribosylamine--glycine ligase
MLRPDRGAAQLEGSKAFTKDFLARHAIPTAEYQNFTEVEPALAYLREKRRADRRQGRRSGGRQGRDRRHERDRRKRQCATCSPAMPSATPARVVIEEFLDGEEASFIVMVDGEHVLPLATSQDHKRAATATPARTPAAWAPTHRPRW